MGYDAQVVFFFGVQVDDAFWKRFYLEYIEQIVELTPS